MGDMGESGRVYIVPACIVGGIVYSGLKVLLKGKIRKQSAWLTPWEGPPPSGAATAEPAEPSGAQEAMASRHYALATASLMLSLGGRLIYAPLGLLSAPLIVYTSIPVFERAFGSLLRESRLRLATVHFAVLIRMLLARAFVAAALVNWFYYYGRLLTFRMRHLNFLARPDLETIFKQMFSQLFVTTPELVWIKANDVELEIPFENLQVGDTLIIGERELIPVEGTVVDGAAKVTLLMVNGDPRPSAKRPGDRLVRMTLVESGRLLLRVDRL